ncbi:lipopolysaccharide cholinephosphotransferase [Oscillospiraceae bacterium]|nr:lipopolysaccharide cholinephosphotransferase [Oscillospiraceae bacterium]
MLSEEFYKEEIRQNYRITTEMKKAWAVELEIMLELDRVCKALSINFFLDCGTLLGAIRDNHFIPWDDDIDVVMLREDYDKLLNDGIHLFGSDYLFQCAYTDTNYPRGHAQLRKKNTCAMIPYEAKHVQFDQSIFIDIFVLEGLPDSQDLLKKQFDEKQKIMKRMSIMGIPASTKPINTIIKKILKVVFTVVYPSIPEMFKQYEDICKRYSYQNSPELGRLMFHESVDKVYKLKREWFEKPIWIKFEGIDVPVPNGYDDILRTYYGDNYMIPVNSGAYHDGLIICVDRSYKEVLKDL